MSLITFDPITGMVVPSIILLAGIIIGVRYEIKKDDR